MKEIWKDIPGFPGYQASTNGRIRSINRILQRSDGVKRFYPGKVLKPTKNRDGYMQVYPGRTLDGQKHSAICVHTLVARAFFQNNVKNAEVNHINGDKTDNSVQNLEWVSREQNIRHAKYILGKHIGTPCKKVFCVETGRAYSSIRNAWRETGIHWSCIARALDGSEGRTKAGGYHWTEL